MADLKKVQETAEKFDNDIVKLAAEIKRVQSVKCRLKKQAGKASFQDDMTKVLTYEELLKSARQLLEPKEKPVPMYEQADVDRLDYDQTVKAIRSIQSKKTLSKWLTETEFDNDEYRNACRVEAMLIEHRKAVQPVDEAYIRKTDLVTVIDTIKMTADITADVIVELLEDLLAE